MHREDRPSGPLETVYMRALPEALHLQVQIVGRLRAGQLDVPSRCAGWSIRDVLEHSVGVTKKFTEFASGRTDEPHAPNVDLGGSAYVAAVRGAGRESAAAWAVADPSRTCRLRFGTFSANAAAGINLFDVLAHTWDIAAAVSLALPADDPVWEMGLQAAQRVISADRDSKHYAPALSLDAAEPPLARFLAFLGRRW